MSDWADLMVRDLLESVGMEEHGDGLFSPILPARKTDGHPARSVWN